MYRTAGTVRFILPGHAYSFLLSGPERITAGTMVRRSGRFFALHRRAHGYAATLAQASKRTHKHCGGIPALPTGSRRSVNEAIHQRRVHHLKNPFALVTVNNQPVSLASPPCGVSLNDEARTFTIPRYLGREVRVSCTNSTHTHASNTIQGPQFSLKRHHGNGIDVSTD